MRFAAAAPAAASTHAAPGDDTTFFSRRFLETWYRGHGHLQRDLERFVTTYRVPPRQRAHVCEAVHRAVDRVSR